MVFSARMHSKSHNICYALQGKGYFPYDTSVLEIDNELDWNPDVTNLNEYPLTIADDGSLIYYKYVDLFYRYQSYFQL